MRVATGGPGVHTDAFGIPIAPRPVADYVEQGEERARSLTELPAVPESLPVETFPGQDVHRRAPSPEETIGKHGEPLFLRRNGQADAAGAARIVLGMTPAGFYWIVTRLTVMGPVAGTCRLFINDATDPTGFLDETDQWPAVNSGDEILVPEASKLIIDLTGVGNATRFGARAQGWEVSRRRS